MKETLINQIIKLKTSFLQSKYLVFFVISQQPSEKPGDSLVYLQIKQQNQSAPK